jgi:hypothetical protein
MDDICRARLTATEAEEKLDWLLFQRRRHFDAHEIGINLATFGAIFVASAEMIEDTLKLRWGKLAQAMMSLVNRKADLLKIEANSPGKELNYLMLAEKQFGNQNRNN